MGSRKRGQVPGSENKLHKRQNSFLFKKKKISHMRELYRRLVDYRKTRTGEITRRKRIRCLKKQEQVFGFTDAEIEMTITL